MKQEQPNKEDKSKEIGEEQIKKSLAINHQETKEKDDDMQILEIQKELEIEQVLQAGDKFFQNAKSSKYLSTEKTPKSKSQSKGIDMGK